MPELITEEGSGGSRPARGRHERVIQVAKSPGSRIDGIVRLVDGEIPIHNRVQGHGCEGAAIFLRASASSWRGCDDGVVALA